MRFFGFMGFFTRFASLLTHNLFLSMLCLACLGGWSLWLGQ
ncbi:hypothetical protein MASSI9I_60352 [Massilia sp. 9I]|nr:hypothetical protein MASSI9I_60352 [Massilia sp. 9I]